METLRKIIAAVIGILIIVALIFFAKWLGDRIRERIFPTTSNAQKVVNTTPTVAAPAPTRNVPGTTKVITGKSATMSAIPATGPVETAYLLFGLLASAGVASKFVASKISVRA